MRRPRGPTRSSIAVMAESRSYLLAAYRTATTVAWPLATPLLAWRTHRGKEDPARRAERYGIASRPRPPGPLIWVHAASVGETVSVLPVAERLVASGELTCLLTTGTVTSTQVATGRLTPGLVHQYAPLDAARFVRRFLDHWRPGLALFAESELWPNMVTETADSGALLALVNARMSPRSHARWQRRGPAMIRQMLSRFDLCLAQSEGDAERLEALGACEVMRTGNLKFDVPAPQADPQSLSELSAALSGRPCWAAASVHPGEDNAVRDAHMAIAGRLPGMMTILAPRHPERGAEIAARFRAAGLTVARRTADRAPGHKTDIFIMDTIGELGLVFTLAPVVFMGGSLVPHGGQNPIEPAKHSSAVLHGPHIHNFADIYAALDEAGGAQMVGGAEELGGAVARLLDEPRTAQRQAAIAASVVDGFSGALERTLAALEPLVARATGARE
jgi:3-deoxy-D-manno-octulosonic-acid transferase